MTPGILIISKLLSLLTVLSQVFLLFVVIGKFVFKLDFAFLTKRAKLLTFLTAFGASLASLFYSQIAGFIPCDLCWWQRVFLYPQIIILAIALWKKRSVREFVLGLSMPGALVAGYNAYLQYGGVSLFPCSATGISCAQRYIFEFGYVTIPLMALTTFALLILFEFLDKND